MSSDLSDATPIASLTFEEALTRLQDVVLELESGTLTLEESLARYGAGAELADRCQRLIAEAELRITELTPESLGLPPS